MARHWIDKLTRRNVVVHLTDGTSLSGVLLEVHGDCLVLTAARVLADDGSVAVDGETVIPRTRISWMQDLTPGREETA